MIIFLQKNGQTLEREHQGTARELLAQLDVNPETVLIVKDGVLVGEDEPLDGAKRVEFLSVISGG